MAEKKGPNLREFLSQLSGVDEREFDSILDEVKRNQKQLDECKGPHDFQPDPKTAVGILVRDYRCTKCKGKVESSNARWYIRGLEHGRR